MSGKPITKTRAALERQIREQTERQAAQFRHPPPTPLQSLSQAVEQWRNAAIPERPVSEGRQPTIEKRHAAKVEALKAIRKALHELGAEAEAVLRKEAESDPTVSYGVWLLYDVSIRKLGANLAVPPLYHHDPVYNALDVWLNNGLLRTVGAFSSPSTTPPLVSEDTDKRSGLRSQRTLRPEKTDARDKWLYRQASKKNPPTWKALMGELKRIADKHGWRRISSEQGVEQAVKRYIKYHSLPSLPPRKSD